MGNMKKQLMWTMVGCLALAFGAKAQYLTGTVTGEEIPVRSAGVATASSMKLFETNVLQSVTGGFAGIVPDNGILTADPIEISGLSTTPLAVSINNYFEFSGQDIFPGYQAPGSNPSNRFAFNLASLEEVSYDSGTGQALFTGTGTIIDSLDDFQDTSADLTVNFSGPGTYTFSLEAVPEPATISMAGAGLLGLLALRRRRGWKLSFAPCGF
jgi:PEP-CTERM motif